jgi:importin-5
VQHWKNSGNKTLQYFAGQSWPELLGALFQASQSADAGQREGAFRIFATTPGIIETQHEAAVQEVFAKGFKDENVNVRTRLEIDY